MENKKEFPTTAVVSAAAIFTVAGAAIMFARKQSAAPTNGLEEFLVKYWRINAIKTCTYIHK